MVLEILKEKLKNAVRYFYDLQELRMQTSSRSSKKAAIAEAHLDEDDKAFLEKTGDGLKTLEKDALKEVARLLKGIALWEDHLKPNVRGVAETLAGVFLAEINIENCNTVSQLWAWCGLAVVDGHAVKRKKGEKLTYNPWLKAKMLKVLGDCLIKAGGTRGDDGRYYLSVQSKGPDGKGLWEPALDENGEILLDTKGRPKRKKVMEKSLFPDDIVNYKKFYDDYKHRKEHEQVDVCMGCEGKGTVTRVERDVVVEAGTKKPRKDAKCENCGGTGGPAPWGASQDHRHKAANRYMVKMFLLDLWKYWRELEGLEVRPPYAEEYLGRKHHPKEGETLPKRPPKSKTPQGGPSNGATVH